jgi:hypothetical protein
VYQVFNKSHRQAKSKQIWSKIPSTTHCTTPLLNPWSVNPWVLTLSISFRKGYILISLLLDLEPPNPRPPKRTHADIESPVSTAPSTPMEEELIELAMSTGKYMAYRPKGMSLIYSRSVTATY